MGFSSYKCKGCEHPALSAMAVNKVNSWMVNVVAIMPNNVDIFKGEFDGYCSVGETPVYGEKNPDLYHFACWTKAGTPMEYAGGSEWADDQGWFFNEGDHDMEEPRTQ